MVVTGGEGFIGQHVVRRLADAGHDVASFDLHASRTRYSNVEYLIGNILEAEDLLPALTGADAIVHLAAVADIRQAVRNPLLAGSVNAQGTLNVLSGAGEARVRRVVYASTCWVYSECRTERVDEETPIPPPSHIYAATKYAGELYCLAYRRSLGTGAYILRLGIPYGPGARDGTAITNFTKQAQRGRHLTIHGDGTQVRQFIHVDDIARAIDAILRQSPPHAIFNIDGPVPLTIHELALMVTRMIRPVEIEFTASRSSDYRGHIVTIDRAFEELGWQPSVKLEDGLRSYAEWLQGHVDGQADADVAD